MAKVNCRRRKDDLDDKEPENRDQVIKAATIFQTEAEESAINQLISESAEAMRMKDL